MVFTKLVLMKRMPCVHLYFFIFLICNYTKSSLDLQKVVQIADLAVYTKQMFLYCKILSKFSVQQY